MVDLRLLKPGASGTVARFGSLLAIMGLRM